MVRPYAKKEERANIWSAIDRRKEEEEENKMANDSEGGWERASREIGGIFVKRERRKEST